jgi:4-alpha-glucanotransferase
LEFFDYVRLDHFRAFCSFWSVPPGEKNAVNGSWEPGPGVDFFEALRKEVGDLRLIAEDLGDIDKEVYALRDKLKLPGMKVLQFGFGSDFPTSTHLPHNYGERFIAYPGTHDNNTTRGWFENDMSADGRRHLTDYFNTRVNKGNVAELLTRACYASHAQSVVVAMQDVLRLGAKARINKPSTTSGNWTWRMKELPTQDVINKLRSLVWGYER